MLCENAYDFYNYGGILNISAFIPIGVYVVKNNYKRIKRVRLFCTEASPEMELALDIEYRCSSLNFSIFGH